FHKMAKNPHTTWVLYAVIIVSAVVIAGAIPVLLRARRLSLAESPGRAASGRPRTGGGPAESGSLATRPPAEQARPPRVAGAEPVAAWSSEAVSRVWLRGTVLLATTMGAALIPVAAATYLMAVGHDGASWIGYGLAGAITAAMPVVEFLHVRQLRRVIAEEQ
ncbi:MAG: DUF2561 family protein, partial [Mycobacterium sp.]|nr:DUF2561 family protein [Mycobacterium sp.]